MQVIQINEEIWVQVKAAMCDEYCKHPFSAETQAELNEICDRCPLNTVEYPLGYCPHQE